MLQVPIVVEKRRRPWVVPLCGCCGYVNKSGEKVCCPLFCPMSMICTGLIAGRIWTRLSNEDVIFNGMGCQGCTLCMVSLPISIYGPVGGMCMFFFLSWCLRERVIEKFNVEEEKACCFGPCNPTCDWLHLNCNYPCSFFQMYVSMLEWEEENATIPRPVGVVIAQPVGAVAVSPVHPQAMK